jgi:uncharacterized protein (UPF0548 family)
MLAESRRASPTYAEIGATRDATLPPGYRHDRYEAVVGDGRRLFDASIEAIRSWQAQRGAGIDVVPSAAWVEESETVLLLIRAGVFEAVAPCRVVYVVEDPGRFSFAYGTLPGHPERGEVAFTIGLDAAETVTFKVVSFSRRVDPLARLGAPLARRLQQRVTRGYVTALQEAVR